MGGDSSRLLVGSEQSRLNMRSPRDWFLGAWAPSFCLIIGLDLLSNGDIIGLDLLRLG